MPMNEPPVIRHLDFSEFHPLDHTVWYCYRRGYPGGVRRHLSYRWEFQWKDKAARWKCLLGWHHSVTWWREDVITEISCRRCGKVLEPPP